MALLVEKLSPLKLPEEMKTKLLIALTNTYKLVEALKAETTENLLVYACKRLVQEQPEPVLIQTRKAKQFIHQLRIKISQGSQ